MEYADSILMAILIFIAGVVSPGPNFIAVTHQSLNRGFRSGFITGLGVATGDLIYAAAGFFGLASFIDPMGSVFGTIKLLGGLYLGYLGIKMIVQRKRKTPFGVRAGTPAGLAKSFRFGLLTDLANPKTIIFFASILATTIQPDTPIRVLWIMLFCIVATSVIWRTGLSFLFSRSVPRQVYFKFRNILELAFGVFLTIFGLRLSFSSISVSYRLNVPLSDP